VTWVDGVELGEPLRDLRGDEDSAERLRAELVREVRSGHPLHGSDPRVVAEAIPQDEVVVTTFDGRVALVHLTWRGRTETPPRPTALFLESAEHLAEVLEFRY
jgi:hypothetical protein